MHISWKSVIIQAFVAACVLFSLCVHAQQCDPQFLTGPGFRGFDSPPSCGVMWDPDGPGPLPPRLVVGGGFTIAGNGFHSCLAMWDGENWLDVGGGVNGGVGALAVDAAGRLLVAGRFSKAGNTVVSNVAAWDGVAWSPLGQNMDGGVYCIAFAKDGALIAAGSIITVEGTPANNIIRWDGSAWHPVGLGTTGQIYSVAVMPNGDIVACGEFYSAGGVTVRNVARWDGTAWNKMSAGLPGIDPFGSDPQVNKVFVARDGTLYAASPVDKSAPLARWNGTAWSDVGDSTFAGKTYGIAETREGQLCAVGYYKNGAASVIVWNGTAWSAAPHAPGATNGASSVFPADHGDLIVAGAFFGLSAPSYNYAVEYIVRWDGVDWHAMGGGPFEFPHNSEVRAIVELDDGSVMIGGSFQGLGFDSAVNLVRYDGANWTAPGGAVLGAVNALARMPNGDIIAAGTFSTIGGVACKNIARWNGSTWSPVGAGLGSAALALQVMPDGSLIAAGSFAVDGAGHGMNCISQWDGSTWHNLAGGVSGKVYNTLYISTLELLSDGKLVVGGSFLNAGKTVVNSIAVWDGTSWSALGQGLHTNTSGAQVNHVLRLPNGDLLAGGLMESSDGNGLSGLARWNGNTWIYGAWNTYTGETPIVEYKPMFVRAPNGDIIAAGQFSEGMNLPALDVRRWDGTAWTILDHGDADYVNSIVCCRNGDIVFGGPFRAMGHKVSSTLARWVPNASPRLLTPPAAQSVADNGTVTLRAVPVLGFPDTTYRWLHDGQALTDGPGGASSGGGSVWGASGSLSNQDIEAVFTLAITGVKLSDAGTYTLELSNKCGLASADAKITVFCPADFNGDQTLDCFDFFDFVTCFEGGPCPPGTSADFNGDGFADIFDFNDFVTSFEIGC